jgi:hypothetical protein
VVPGPFCATLKRYCRSEEEGFSRPVVVRLLEALEAQPLPHLTPNEHSHLMVLIQTTLEVRVNQSPRYEVIRYVQRLTNNGVPLMPTVYGISYRCDHSISSMTEHQLPAVPVQLTHISDKLGGENVFDIVI